MCCDTEIKQQLSADSDKFVYFTISLTSINMPSKHRVFNMLITEAPVVTLGLCKEVTFLSNIHYAYYSIATNTCVEHNYMK